MRVYLKWRQMMLYWGKVYVGPPIITVSITQPFTIAYRPRKNDAKHSVRPIDTTFPMFVCYFLTTNRPPLPTFSVLDSMPLQQRLATLQTPKIEIPSPGEPILKSQPLSPTKLKVTRQSHSLYTPKKQESTTSHPPPPPLQQQQPVEEEVCLRWNSHHSNMQTSFPDLLQKEQYVDVTLASEGKMLKCHRVRPNIRPFCCQFFMFFSSFPVDSVIVQWVFR